MLLADFIPFREFSMHGLFCRLSSLHVGHFDRAFALPIRLGLLSGGIETLFGFLIRLAAV